MNPGGDPPRKPPTQPAGPNNAGENSIPTEEPWVDAQSASGRPMRRSTSNSPLLNGAAGRIVEETSDGLTRVSSVDSIELYMRRCEGCSSDGNGPVARTVTRRHVPAPEMPTNSDQIRDWTASIARRWEEKRKTYKWTDWVSLVMPSVRWMREYDFRQFFLADLIAGLTVAGMVVPQSVSYANIAGLPAQFGLYSAFVPVLVYAFFGSSRQLAVGPVAIVSLLLNDGLKSKVPGYEDIEDYNNLANDEERAIVDEYVKLAIQTSLLAGLMYMAVGVCRLGFLSNFLSHSVISGFTTGAAIIIGLSQVKHLVGYKVPKGELHDVVEGLFSDIDKFQWREFVMGMSWIVLLLVMKHLGKTVPRFKWMRPLGPITVCVLSISISSIFKLDDHGITLVGDIPKGLPPLSVSEWSPLDSSLVGTAFVVTLVGLMESISISKALALKNKYELDANQELVGLGLANVAGAVFSAYPSTGSFSRSAVANDTGAKSGVAGLMTALTVGLTLLLLTPVFANMPQNALAAIVISGVIGLVEWTVMLHLWAVNKVDWLIWMTSCLGTLFLGVEIGLGIAIGLAVLFVIAESAFPHTAVLGRLPATTVYRNIKQYREARTINGMVIVRVDSPIYFANVSWVKERMRKYELRAEQASLERGMQLRFVILELSPVNHVDATAVHGLEEVVDSYKERGVQLVLVNPNMKVMKALMRAGFLDKLGGKEWIFVRMQDAVDYCQAITDGVTMATNAGSGAVTAVTLDCSGKGVASDGGDSSDSGGAADKAEAVELAVVDGEV